MKNRVNWILFVTMFVTLANQIDATVGLSAKMKDIEKAEMSTNAKILGSVGFLGATALAANAIYESSQTTIAGAALISLAIGIPTTALVHNFLTKASNEELIARSNLLIKEYEEAGFLDVLNMDKAEDIQKFFNDNFKSVEKAEEFCHKFLQYYIVLSGRYNSYVTPWNWTNEMYESTQKLNAVYQKSLVIYLASVYKDVLSDLNSQHVNYEKIREETRSLSWNQTKYTLYRGNLVLVGAINILLANTVQNVVDTLKGSDQIHPLFIYMLEKLSFIQRYVENSEAHHFETELMEKDKAIESLKANQWISAFKSNMADFEISKMKKEINQLKSKK